MTVSDRYRIFGYLDPERSTSRLACVVSANGGSFLMAPFPEGPWYIAVYLRAPDFWKLAFEALASKYYRQHGFGNQKPQILGTWTLLERWPDHGLGAP